KCGYTMTRFFTIIFFLSIAAIGKAQDGVNHFFFRGGAVYERAGQVSIGFDFSSKYHSAYELGLTYYRDRDKYENYLVGLNYKSVIVTNKNTQFRCRVGTFGGTYLKRFIAAQNFGMELFQTTSPHLNILYEKKNGSYFWANQAQRRRIAAEVGLRYPL